MELSVLSATKGKAGARLGCIKVLYVQPIEYSLIHDGVDEIGPY